MYLLFFAVWILLNGKITLEIVIFGLLVSAALFLFICKFMNYSFKKELRLFTLLPQLIGYLFVLFWEIIKANFAVTKMIFTSKYELEPAVGHFKSPLKSKVLNAILANSITLTPGTITVASENGEFTVHALDKDFLKGIDDSIFVKLLLQMEKGGNK